MINLIMNIINEITQSSIQEYLEDNDTKHIFILVSRLH